MVTGFPMEKYERLDFTCIASDQRVGRHIQLIKYMKLSESSRSFLDLDRRSFTNKS